MERKLATVLFADLVGSTAMGAELDPEYARDLLERFYDAMEWLYGWRVNNCLAA